jgi:N-acetylneuraminic acid mutarotase
MIRSRLSWMVMGALATVGCGNETFPTLDEPAFTEGSFIAGPNLTETRFEHASVVLHDGRVLVCGGAGNTDDPPWITRSTVEIFDPGMNQWSAGPDMLLARFAHQAVLLEDGDVLIMGGQNNDFPGHFACAGNTSFPTPYICNAEVFDVNTGWSTSAAMDMTYPRIHFVATPVKQGQNVIVAGGTAQEFPGLYESFDAFTRSWTAISAPANGIRADHADVALPNEDALLIGGAGANGQVIAKVDRFDVDTQAWKNAGSIQIPRYHHTATSLGDGRAIITGGTSYGSGATLESTEIYDEKTNTWTFGPPMHEERTGHSATLLIGNRRLLVVGGVSVSDLDGKTIMLDSAEILDLETMTWTRMETPLARRWRHTAHLLPTDGRVLLIGGAELIDGEITSFTSTAIFTPPSCSSHFDCAPAYRCNVNHVCIPDTDQSN